MELKTAYSNLGYEDPVFYSLEKSQAPSVGGLRATGATTHMLIELLLDLFEAERTFSLSERQRLSFVCICSSSSLGRFLRIKLEQYNTALNLKVSLSRVRFILKDVDEDRLRGETFYTWGVYSDHMVKEDQNLKRLVGPYILIRRIEWNPGEEYKTYDRDGNYILSVDRKAAFSIVKESSCPISVISGPGVEPTCMAAWRDHKFNRHMRLRKRFEF